MKIALWNASCFVGSNFSNYLLQHTKHDLVCFLCTSTRSTEYGFPHMEGALSSRSRVSYQVAGSDEHGKDTLARLHLEKPDLVVCFEEVPLYLEGKYNTIYLGKDPTVTGCDRTLLYSGAFGPRQSPRDPIAAAILNGIPLRVEPTQAIYVKDLFDQFLSFIGRTSRFAVAEGGPLTNADIKAAISGDTSTKMQNAVAHTHAWYHDNKWFSDID